MITFYYMTLVRWMENKSHDLAVPLFIQISTHRHYIIPFGTSTRGQPKYDTKGVFGSFPRQAWLAKLKQGSLSLL